LTPIPISIGEIPPGTDLKVFHRPVRMFIEGQEDDISVYSAWVKSSSSRQGHHIRCQGGLFAGSSGAPYVTRRGFVVGMHVESANEAHMIEADFTSMTTSEAIELVSDTINSNTNVHSSILKAIQFSKCRRLCETLRSLQIPLSNTI